MPSIGRPAFPAARRASAAAFALIGQPAAGL